MSNTQHISTPNSACAAAAPAARPIQEIVDGQALLLEMGVREGRERQLAIADILRRHVGAACVGDQGKVVRGAQQARDEQVDVDEVREIGELEPALQLRQIGAGQALHLTMTSRQLQQSRRLDSALEMDVHLGFRQCHDEVLQVR